MAETSFATTQEIFDGESLVNGDVTAAQDELIRRLKYHLPLLIAEENTRRGWTGAQAIPPIVDVIAAPGDLTDQYIGYTLVGMSVDTMTQGIGAFRNTITVSIFTIDQAVQQDQQVRVLWRRGELIRAALLPYLAGCVNDNDVICWSELAPLGLTILPKAFEEYAGTTCIYRLTQGPRSN